MWVGPFERWPVLRSEEAIWKVPEGREQLPFPPSCAYGGTMTSSGLELSAGQEEVVCCWWW